MAGLKYELEQWNEGVIAFDQGLYEDALDVFESIADSAKIHFNIGVVLATMGDFESASAAYLQATKLDQYLSIAYFQNGVANVAMENYSEALKCFHEAFLYLRGNMMIDYTQLGLDHKLYSCQVLYNRALCYIEVGEIELAMSDLYQATIEKQTKEHDVLDQAFRNKGVDCTVFTVPSGVLYRPAEAKVKNSKKKDYLGNSKVIAAVDASDSFAGFQGRSAWQVQMSGPINIAAEEPRPSTPPNGLQRRPTERSNGRARRGTDPERPQLEHDNSFNGNEASTARRPGGPGPSNLGPAGSESRPTLLFRRNTEAQKPAPLDLGGYSNRSPPGGQSSGVPPRNPRRPGGDLDDLEHHVHALTLESHEIINGGDYYNMPAPARSNSNNARPGLLRNASQSKGSLSRNNSNGYHHGNNNNNNNNNHHYHNHNGYGSSPPSRTGTPPTMLSSELRRVGSNNGMKYDMGLHREDSVRSQGSGGSGDRFYQQPNGNHSGYMYGAEGGSYLDEPTYAGLRDKVRVKCHYIDTRAVLVRADTPLHELIQKVQEKFQTKLPLKLKYKDEDQHMLSMVDDDDWLMAQQVHIEFSGSLDRIELWCFDEE